MIIEKTRRSTARNSLGNVLSIAHKQELQQKTMESKLENWEASDWHKEFYQMP